MDDNYRLEILTQAYNARVKEITEYQVNIDNFKLAINKIKDDVELTDFKTQLENLLTSSVLEQRKAKIMLDVIQEQMG